MRKTDASLSQGAAKRAGSALRLARVRQSMHKTMAPMVAIAMRATVAIAYCSFTSGESSAPHGSWRTALPL